MIANEVYIVCTAVLESEDDPPVAGHGHGPESVQLSLQGMKPVTRESHVLYRHGFVQPRQDSCDLIDL